MATLETYRTRVNLVTAPDTLSSAFAACPITWCVVLGLMAVAAVVAVRKPVRRVRKGKG